MKASDAETGQVITRPGIYPCGAETVDAILKAALQILIEEGAGGFTLRRIAAKCDLQVGNVSRHFPRKEMLIQVLLEELLMPSEGLMKGMLQRPEMSAESALILIMGGTLDYIETQHITRLFTELWAMANQSEFVASRVETVYRYVNSLIAPLIKQINPSLSEDDIESVSVFINATLEGTTMFAGYQKPWAEKMPQVKAIAVKSLIHCIKTITPDDLKSTEFARA